MKHALTSAVLLALLAACSPSNDLQGHDPREYYAEHPIKNTVEERQLTQTVLFAPGSSRVAPAEIAQIKQAMGDISPLAVRSIEVQFPQGESSALQKSRARMLTKQLRQNGFSMKPIMTVPQSTGERDMVQVVITYSAAIPPRCPDWRASPLTTYSNANTGNYSCASAVNLGKMVADPKDLVRGSGNVRPDGERNHLVMQQYYGAATTAATGGTTTANGGAVAAASSSGGVSSGSSSGGAATAAPQ